MKQTILGIAFLLAGTPAGAQHVHQAQQPAPPATQPAAVSQAIPPPEKMDDSIPPAAEFVSMALEKSPRHAEWIDVPLADAAPTKAWVVYPETKSRAGVVIVVHENRGLNDWARAVADPIAEDGYIAIAVDLLSGKGPGGGNTDSIAPAEIGKVFSSLQRAEINARLDRVREYAIQMPAANGRVGMVGFCWGGGTVFQYAVHQPALNAAVVYYGPAPQEPAQIERIAAPLLGLFGEDDARVNTTIDPVLAILNKDRTRFTTHVFAGAGHGFLRQQFGRAANLRAAERAWPLTIDFFGEHLK